MNKPGFVNYVGAAARGVRRAGQALDTVGSPLAAVSAAPPKPTADHSRRRARRALVPVTVVTRPCDELPVEMPWFESVAEAQRRAQRGCPSVFKAIRAGAERGLTLADNVAAFAELGFAPHVAGLVAERDLSTTVMGQRSSLPVLISPTGVQAVHPDGEVAVARAAAARGTAMGLSSFASKPVEEVVAANPQTFFQVYWVGLARADRGARRAGPGGRRGRADRHARLDVLARPRLGQPDRSPSGSTSRRWCGSRPRRCARPRWLYRWARTGQPARARPCPTWPRPAQPAPTFFGAYGEWMRTPPPTWDDLRWLREEWDGPFMLKGVMRVDDARRAVETSASPRSRSPTTAATTSTGRPRRSARWPAIAEAVGDELEVLLDGGIRRGGDVVKALALGARAVMIGRAYLWGLAADGQAGVENVLDVLRSGIDSALLGLGRASVHELEPVRPAHPRWLRAPASRRRLTSADDSAATWRGDAARRPAGRDRAARPAPAAGDRHDDRVARWPRAARDAVGGAGAALRLQRRARGLPGTLSIGQRGAGARAGRARALARRFAARAVRVRARRQRRAARRARCADCAARGATSGRWSPALGRRRPRRPDRDLADARPRAGARRPAARPGNVEPLAALLPRLRAEGVRAVSPNGVLGDPRRVRRGGPRAARRRDRGLARSLIRYIPQG